MIKICEHWRPPYSKHELGSGDWVETPTKKWQNRSKPFNMNHKHVKTTWTINMWKNVTTDHYSMISGNNFPNMNCIAVIGYKLQNGDMFCFLVFPFLSFFFFWRKSVKIWKIMKNVSIFREKRTSYTRCKGVPGAMCCGKLYDSLRFGGILDPRVLCGQLCAFISISALTHVVFSQWSFGPYGQASSRSRSTDARNESFPCVHVWSGLCIACPYPCWIVLILFWWIDEVRCCTWPKTTLVPDVPFLSVVVRPRGQRCQNKISFDRLQPEQIKQDEVKSFEFYLFYMYIYFLLCIFISFYVYLFLFMYIYVFYFLLFLFISFYFCLLLFIYVYFFLSFMSFISFYFFFLAKKEKYDFKMCFFDFRIIQTIL